MASILKVDEMQGVTAAGDITVTDGSVTFKMQDALSKAWNSFQGTGSIVFIKSFQCSSLVDANTGDYDVNLTSAMDSTSYSVLVSSGYNVVHNASETLGYANTTTQYSTLHYENNTRYDIPYLSGQINGDLA